MQTLSRPLSLSADYLGRYNGFVMHDGLKELEAKLRPEVHRSHDRQKKRRLMSILVVTIVA
jgi:hypothetical protein